MLEKKQRLLINTVLILVSLGVAFLIFRLIIPQEEIVSSHKLLLERKIKKMGEPLNPYILEVIENFPTGVYKICDNRRMKTCFGVTRDIYYQGKRVVSTTPDHCVYCIGLVFEVFMDAWELHNKRTGQQTIGSLNKDNIIDFRKRFYGVYGNKKTFVDALTRYGLGVEITNPELAEPGDLVQFWRYNNIGHAVIFQQWIRDANGKITGIQYWSAQRTTNGIDYHSEEIGPHRNDVRPDKIYIVRPIIPK